MMFNSNFQSEFAFSKQQTFKEKHHSYGRNISYKYLKHLITPFIECIFPYKSPVIIHNLAKNHRFFVPAILVATQVPDLGAEPRQSLGEVAERRRCRQCTLDSQWPGPSYTSNKYLYRVYNPIYNPVTRLLYI